MKVLKTVLVGAALACAPFAATAQNEQFIPMNGYWVGPYAPGGSGIFGGFIDYVNMVNARDGGVNGVKLPAGLMSNLELIVFGGLIIFFLIVEPHGLARLWQIGKEKLRLWPFPH